MADTTVEKQGLRLKVHDISSGAFSIDTHDLAGGAGVADASLEIEGYRVAAHDNGDGTFSLVTTTTTGASDVTVEHQGLRLKLHPSGSSDLVTGQLLYAVVVVVV